ncbi:MAG: S-adenosylmethionine:tRNA ribosyltransferase-isomerase [Bacteroidetes bacterium]|uniref:S-adenosylmethionine:tRNA ribosyltransferase-isomerase n=1 Tax=Candidatus Enterocola intestinipullorum TaxID=2840783 RepID=A0A9D9HCW6_9BACT|nr:S-adenosylmethionine:tRNA ribosyltransferase-isomerase [Candidatus Enterocola intestinipullorum]
MTDVRKIRIEDYDYVLPEDRIAKYPLSRRDSSKLLVYRNGNIGQNVFKNLADELSPDSFLVFNNTKVIQARLLFKKSTGAQVEVFCLEPFMPADYQLNFQSVGSCEWKCMIGNAKRWKEGCLFLETVIEGSDLVLRAERTGECTDNSFTIRFSWNLPVCFSQILEALGHLPIPPYLNREAEESDKRTYQTVYSKIEGSVAAPTAGLHFTDEVLQSLKTKGIGSAEITLHVGAGTFRPVKSEYIGGHPMHCEHIEVTRGTLCGIKSHLGHITAVGTTSVRTLESLYHIGCNLLRGKTDCSVGQWQPYDECANNIAPAESLQAILDFMDGTGQDRLMAGTNIIIVPGYRFRVVDSLITNFHQPRSTLLLLLAAFVGDDWRKIYKFAMDNGFRFLSYGDSSLLFNK